jgi:hypothetical protein
VSVDTYLKGKNTLGYASFAQDDVKILVPPQLLRWVRRIQIDTKRFLLWHSFAIEAELKQPRSCRR